jgi:hypothetical protein
LRDLVLWCIVFLGEPGADIVHVDQQTWRSLDFRRIIMAQLSYLQPTARTLPPTQHNTKGKKTQEKKEKTKPYPSLTH